MRQMGNWGWYMRVDVFKEADELIMSGFKIPIFEKAKISYHSEPNKSFVTSADFKTIHLGDMLQVIKSCYLKIQEENDGLKKDLRTILENGAIHYFCDEYYSNRDSVEEAIRIYHKRFPLKKETQ